MGALYHGELKKGIKVFVARNCFKLIIDRLKGLV